MDIRDEIRLDSIEDTANQLKNKLNTMKDYEICDFIDNINKLLLASYEMSGTGLQHSKIRIFQNEIKKVLP